MCGLYLATHHLMMWLTLSHLLIASIIKTGSFERSTAFHQAFEPVPHSPAHSEFYTHFFQVRCDEILDLAQVFQVVAFLTRHMCDMSTQYCLTSCFGAVFDPDLDDERLCIGL